MFEGKIRPCLECGEVDHVEIYPAGRLSSNPTDSWTAFCYCPKSGTSSSYFDYEYQAVNQWNIANTPPDDIVY